MTIKRLKDIHFDKQLLKRLIKKMDLISTKIAILLGLILFSDSEDTLKIA